MLTALLALTLAAPAATAELRTLRVDYFHTGGATEERFAPAGVTLEGRWAGPPAGDPRWLDDSNLGKYRFEVIDPATQRVLYSRGYSSVFAEWQTVPEAARELRTFHESLRFPEPAGPVQVLVKKRDAQNLFRELWSLRVDPRDLAVDRSSLAHAPQAWAVQRAGDPSDKVDLLLLGDGYTAAEMEKWHGDARRLAELLFAVSPFKERRADFNVWAVDTPSDESGVARPSDGVHRRSALRAAYDAFGSERYVLALDNQRLREAAAAAPYEFVEIVVNERKYGGGGIQGAYATVAADNAFAPYLFVHEFGHHFAGLADEYYTSAVAYATGGEKVEPWEPNATADPAAAKWRELLTPGLPLPTAWPKEAFEERQREIQKKRRELRAAHAPEAEMEALFKAEREEMSKLLAGHEQAGRVGAFEGALYEARGYYRPQADCVMFTRDEVGFCAVCRRALERVIDQYAKRR